MTIIPHKEVKLKQAQILDIEYTIVGICGNCKKAFGDKNTLNGLSNDEIKKTWVTCPHCDFENVVEGLNY